MIEVHSLEHSRSHRVLWLLEELALPYSIVHYKRDPKTRFAPESLRALNPLRKSPVIVDGGVTLAESGAIVEYIVDRYGNGRLRPAVGDAEFPHYLFWLHFPEATLASAHIPVMALTPLGEPAKAALHRFETLYEQALSVVEAALANGPFLLGDSFTAADIQTGYSIDNAVQRGTVDSRFPRMVAYVEMLRARPAYARAKKA